MMSAPPTDPVALEAFLAQPTDGVRQTCARIEGDVLILGVGGKMGTTLALMLRTALREAGRPGRVIGVSRFSNPAARAALERLGVETVACDLLDPVAVAALPDCADVFFLAGQKFGTGEAPELTWMMNAVVPSIVAPRFRDSRLVVFSTGCVYPFVPVDGPGAREDTPVSPVGEYAYTCVGRERVFTHFSRRHGTPVTFYRLNYAVEPRYGVLVDVAVKVRRGDPVDLSTGHVNVIWQGDAVARAIQGLDLAASPPVAVNVTGGETLQVRAIARRFGEIFGREPRFVGEPAPTAWLADASRSIERFGPPTVSTEQAIVWIADYLERGGALLGKPTHFESRSGEF